MKKHVFAMKPVLALSCSSFSTAIRKTIKPRANRPIIQSQRKRNADQDVKAQAYNLDWRIVASTILHRYPTITPDPLDWEIEKWTMDEKIEAKQREFLMDKIQGTGAQMIPDHFPSEQEILDSLPFKPASRITEADVANDRRSLNRKLTESVYLIVKRNRRDNAWQFPQGKLLDSESSLRMASERVLDRAVGKMNRWFISNSPCGHFSYEYPEDMQQQRKQYGAKVYYYRTQFIGGTVKLETRLYTDYAWIARSEVGEYFDESTAELLQAMLPD